MQLFEHFIGNSLKYRREYMALIIDVGMSEGKEKYEYWVNDNGIGINQEYKERIFVIFQRLHTSEKYGGGAGIGPALAKKIIEYYGGSIQLNSIEGEGSTFCFSLPKNTALSKDRAA